MGWVFSVKQIPLQPFLMRVRLYQDKAMGKNESAFGRLRVGEIL